MSLIMDSDDRLAQRVDHIKQALAEITSSLMEERPPRPYTAANFRLSPDFEDLSSSRSQDLHDLRRQLDLAEGRNRRLEEKLRATEQTYREMSELMEELYKTVEELQTQKRVAQEQTSNLKDLEHHYDSQRKQLVALQTSLAQKERLITRYESERGQLLEQVERKPPRGEGETLFLNSEVQRLSRENAQLAEEFHRTSQENVRLSSDLRKSLQGDSEVVLLKQANMRLQQDLESISVSRESFTRELKAKDEQIRDLTEKIYEKQLVAEAYKRPVDRAPRDSPLHASLCNLLGEKSPDELLATVESLMRTQKHGGSASALVDKLGRLIQDCAPLDTDQGSPSAKQIWRWVRRLVEEYMGLKGHKAALEKVVDAVARRLGVKTLSEVDEAVASLVQERNSLKSLEGKVKALVTDSEPIKILD